VNIIVKHGRPVIESLLTGLINISLEGGGVGIGACGPQGMITDLERLVAGIDQVTKTRVGGVEMHAERFSL